MSYFNQITGWQLLRAVIPPWQNTDDPLISYELRHQRRAGRRPWSLIAMGYLLMMLLLLYLIIVLFQDSNNAFWDETLGNILAFVGVGLGLMVMIGHWRLLMAISGRAATTIAGRRRNGDWDLIAITPLDKTRWYTSQLTIISWQVFPIIRQLLMLHFLLVVGGIGTLSYLLHQLRIDDQTSFYSEEYLPLPIFWILVIPIGIFLILEPFWATAIFSSVSLYTSSRSQRLTMSILYTFLNTFVTRYTITLVLFYGGLLVIFLVGNFASLLGTDTSLSFSELLEASPMICGFFCVYALGSSFFIEWLPGLAIMMFMIPSDDGVIPVIFFSVYITGILAYVLTPFRIFRVLGNATIAKLNEREI